MEPMERHALSTVRRKRGQTLVEFALTLPILLVLLFGIIEFGRIFQAWVTLQNSARAAVRYASTGQWNQTLLGTINTNGANDPNSVVPCIASASGSERGQRVIFAPNDPNSPDNRVQVYERGTEMLYATWYSGDDCDPRDEEDQNRRRDLLRVLSIMEEARTGAAGLTVGEIPYIQDLLEGGTLPNGDAYANLSVGTSWGDVPWFNIWDRPLPSGTTPYQRLANSDQRGWFDVMICSSRLMMDPENQSVYTEPPPGSPATATSFVGASRLRFRTVLDNHTMAPACLLNEVPTGARVLEGWTDNRRRPWLDAGGPGDTVTIVITFNHPLITPLGIANFLPLQARRTAVNEAFRTSRAANLGQALPVAENQIIEITPPPDLDDTPAATDPATLAPTDPPEILPTDLPTNAPTATPVQPFTCAGFAVTFTGFSSTSANFAITNPNAQSTTLTAVDLRWTLLSGSAATGMGIREAAVLGSAIWRGFDSTPPLEIGGRSGYSPFLSGTTANVIRGSANGATSFSVDFDNVPVPFSSFYRVDYFNNSVFYIDHPTQTDDCVVTFATPTPTNTPGGFVAPPTATNTPTPVPDCAPGLVRFQFIRFLNGGIAQFDVYNGRNVVAIVQGFRLEWAQPSSGSPIRLAGAYLDGLPGVGDPIWLSGSSSADSSADTVAGAASASPEGVWQRNVALQAGEAASIYFDFEGTSGLLSALTGVNASNYVGSTLTIALPDCGGVGGGGVGGNETVTVVVPTPVPTNTPTRTPTPGPATNTPTPRPPTNTPTRTNTPGPATNTPTPRPATSTATPRPPTNTPTITNTPVTPQATEDRGVSGG